jgi:dienelactone hydrolase
MQANAPRALSSNCLAMASVYNVGNYSEYALVVWKRLKQGSSKKEHREIIMGTIILTIAFVTEVAFAIYCIATQSSQRRLRNFIRIGTLAAFVLFTLVSVIEWSFRWYGLAALLSVWAVLGAWGLMNRKAEAGAYKTGPVILRAIGTLLLVCLAILPALIFPQHTLPQVTGKHEVANVSYTYTDESRTETFAQTGENRKVNVAFWYPKEAGSYPLVVFSHGAFGIKISNKSTFMELASNGYVVCSIDHPYHSLFTVDADGHQTIVDQSFFQGVADVNNGKYDEATTFKLHQQWMDLRVADIHFVLDTILEQAQDPGSDAVYRLVDVEKIGLMGHSLGGESSAQVARERDDIDAVVNLDSNLQGEYLDYVDGQYVMNEEVYPVPILNILADDLVRLIADIPDADTVVAVKRVKATAPEAYEVHLEGTNHMSVTDLPLISPFFVSVINASVPKGGGEEADSLATIEKMNAIVLQFFNVYLKGEGSFTTTGID